MESVGASGDEADVVAPAFGAGVVDLQPDGGEDPVAVPPDGLGDFGERGEPGSAGLGAPAAREFGGVVGVEVAGEDRAECLLEGIAAPEVAAVVSEFAQGRGLFVGEALRFLHQAPSGALELAGCGLVRELA